MSFAVFRKAVLMEDEGREHFIASFATRKEAEDAIERQVKLSNGYFHKSDYHVMQSAE